MLNVLAPEEAKELIRKEFSGNVKTEQIPLDKAFGRVLAEDICAREYVPDFDRSTVDGYAVRASDTFGCSESLPALLTRAGEVLMGQKPSVSVNAGSCAAIPPAAPPWGRRGKRRYGGTVCHRCSRRFYPIFSGNNPTS